MATKQGNNMPMVKHFNEEAIKETIYKYGPISRSQIAELLSLTPPTITTNVAVLVEKGLVEETEVPAEPGAKRGIGRKPVNIDYIEDAGYVIGCELGPYHTYLCVTDVLGNVLAKARRPSPNPSYEKMLAELPQYVADVIDESGAPRKKIWGVGVCVPGFVRQKSGVLRSSHQKGWNDRAIADDLSRRLGLPVRIENNTRARAIREEMSRQVRRPDSFAYYFISKGIACSLMIKNSILSGDTSGAGEAGHMVVQKDGEVCPTCGNKGCLEAYSSEGAIVAKCAALLRQGKAGVLAGLCKKPQAPTIQEVLDAQEKGDEDVRAVLLEAVSYLGIALANIINLISPRQVLIDGRIMSVQENRDTMYRVVSQNLFGLNETEVELEYLPFDAFGGARGAAALAIKKYLIQQSSL